MIIYQRLIYREDLRANPDVLYVFGDNVERKGFAGQAKEMRGEPNAIGVATKWAPYSDDSAYFSDDQYDQIVSIIDNDLGKARILSDYSFGTIIVPLDGIGTGLSQLPTRAPQIYKYICSLGLGAHELGARSV